MQNYHLTHDGAQWKLTKEHAQRASAAFGDASKADAIKQTAKLVEGSDASVKIHLKRGPIQEERTYPRAADPKKSKG